MKLLDTKASTELFTIVAFRYDQKNSILYRNSRDVHKIAAKVVQALRDLDADVISIRRVREVAKEE